MNNILLDPTSSALIQAIEANTNESFKTWTKWAKLELHQDLEMTWTASDIPYFLFNTVLYLVPQIGNASDEWSPVIAATISRARSCQVPMGRWVGPTNPTPDLGRQRPGWTCTGIWRLSTTPGGAYI